MIPLYLSDEGYEQEVAIHTGESTSISASAVTGISVGLVVIIIFVIVVVFVIRKY